MAKEQTKTEEEAFFEKWSELEESSEMEEYYWLFRNKKSGYVTISRHSRPDFVAGITEGHIRQHFDRALVRFRKGRFDFEETADIGDFREKKDS